MKQKSVISLLTQLSIFVKKEFIVVSNKMSINYNVMLINAQISINYNVML